MSTSIYPSGYDAFIDPPRPSEPGIPGTLLSFDHIDAHLQLIDAVKALQTHVGSDGETAPASVEQRLVGVIAVADAAASAAADAAADAISALAAAALASSDLTDHELDHGAHDIAATVATAIAAHESALDPHAGYALEADLGAAALLDVGTAPGTVAAGDDPRFGTGGLSEAEADLLYAPIAKGVTNGDSHNHDGGDGAQIAYASLSGLPTLGSAAAAATGDFEPSGAVSTHNAVATAHGISAWGATLVDDADANTARSTLGLGTAATTASTAYATSAQGANADSHAGNTSNPHSVSKTQVGLGSVDNTSDASKPVSTAQQTALNLKANLASPTFTGTVVGITAAMVGAPSGSGNSTGTNTGNETTTTVGALLNSATSNATPVDADHIGLMDSAAANIWKKLSWANLKTTLSSTFVTLSGATQNIAGNIGMGIAPTAVLHLKAGTATATTAPLKFTAGTKLTTPEAGAVEFDGENVYISTDARRTLSTREYISSRSDDLITNGFGSLSNNTNFSGFTFDPVDTAVGIGCFHRQTALTPVQSDEAIEVRTDGTRYIMSLYAKGGDIGGGNYNAANINYIGVVCLDIDGNIISPRNSSKYVSSTDTTLAVTLTPGDTTVTLTDAAGWYAGALAYNNNFSWFGYTNSKGYTYPDYTYTRNLSSNYADFSLGGAWASGGIAGNVITLRSPWVGPTVAAGTAVRNCTSGGEYKYIVLNNSALQNSWQYYSSFIGGLPADFVESVNMFRAGTATIKLVFLFNWHGLADTKSRISGVSFKAQSSANLESSIGVGNTYKSRFPWLLPANGLAVEGNAGFGTSAPSARVHAISTTEQLRCGYDASTYLGSTTNSAGVTTFNLVGTAPAAKWAVSDATSNATYDVATFSKNCTGAGAAGLGSRIVFAAKSSTTVDTPQAGISSEWVNATHATRTSRLKLSANDYGGARDGIRIESDGAVPRLGFYGATAVVKPTALTATVSAAPAGGTGTAAGGWDTSTNRDLAIATINNLKTRVDQLETKLQALGLLT